MFRQSFKRCASQYCGRVMCTAALPKDATPEANFAERVHLARRAHRARGRTRVYVRDVALSARPAVSRPPPHAAGPPSSSSSHWAPLDFSPTLAHTDTHTHSLSHHRSGTRSSSCSRYSSPRLGESEFSPSCTALASLRVARTRAWQSGGDVRGRNGRVARRGRRRRRRPRARRSRRVRSCGEKKKASAAPLCRRECSVCAVAPRRLGRGAGGYVCFPVAAKPRLRLFTPPFSCPGSQVCMFVPRCSLEELLVVGWPSRRRGSPSSVVRRYAPSPLDSTGLDWTCHRNLRVWSRDRRYVCCSFRSFIGTPF
nr:uncharacterized protein LOC129384346 isoform X2 [Dermacentor andersoni]